MARAFVIAYDDVLAPFSNRCGMESSRSTQPAFPKLKNTRRPCTRETRRKARVSNNSSKSRMETLSNNSRSPLSQQKRPQLQLLCRLRHRLAQPALTVPVRFLALYALLTTHKLIRYVQMIAAAAGAVPVDSSAIAAEAKAGPSDAAESTTGKKDKKRKRRSEAAKSAVTDTGSTSDAQVAKALVADPPVEKSELETHPLPPDNT